MAVFSCTILKGWQQYLRITELPPAAALTYCPHGEPKEGHGGNLYAQIENLLCALENAVFAHVSALTNSFVRKDSGTTDLVQAGLCF